MRVFLKGLALALPALTALTGCGVGTLATTTSPVSAAKAISGKAFGGQQPVAGSQIGLYAYGSSGYGSAGTLLASATTDSGGYFTIDPSSISCPTPNTPVYIVSVGGNPGSRVNTAISLAAGLGSCSTAANTFVTINEISTAMLAYTLSHFFATGSNDGITADHFGAPADATQTVVTANSGTLNTLLDTKNGYPLTNTSQVSFEGAKLISVGNILGACINSSGPGSPSCSALFSYVTPPNGTAPTNTLEAAVDLAQNPGQNVPYLFALQPQSGAAAFTGGLTAAPADWTLSASYTAAALGLSVDTRTDSTLDIDSSGRVWFPTNRSGAGGVAYFDPASGTFSGAMTSSLVHPQEVALDADNFAWVTDTQSSNVAGYPGTQSSGATVLSIAGSTSNSVTVAGDNSVRFGIVGSDGNPVLAQITNKDSYTLVPGTEVGNGGGFIAASIASDVQGNLGVGGQELSTPTTYDLYYKAGSGYNFVTYQTYQDAGQIAYTGGDFVQARGGYSSGNDGLCIFSAGTCYGMNNDAVRHPSGLAIDGAGSIWMADHSTNTVELIPLTNGSYLTSNNTANNTVYTHDSSNGGTLPSPIGIAVDRAGNVWVSNASCYGTGCTPGSFVLSELIGAGSPTITPIAQQLTSGNNAGTSPQSAATSKLPR